MADDVGGILSGVGNLMSGMANTASSIFNMATSRSNARYQAALQRTNQMWSAQNMPTYTRQGLEKAGYNPLLAVSSGAGAGGAAIPVGSPSGDLGAVGEGLASAGDAIRAKKKEEHDQDNADKLLKAQLGNINAQTAQRVLENKVLQQKIDDYNNPSFIKSIGDLFNTVRNPFSAKNWNNLRRSSSSNNNSSKWQDLDAVRNELFG